MTDLREQPADVIAQIVADWLVSNEPPHAAAAAIIAALPGMVQPLAWRFDEDMPACMDAIGCGHLYRVIRRQNGKGSLRIDNMRHEHSEHESAEAAKAAAQAHRVAEVMQALGINT